MYSYSCIHIYSKGLRTIITFQFSSAFTLVSVKLLLHYMFLYLITSVSVFNLLI